MITKLIRHIYTILKYKDKISISIGMVKEDEEYAHYRTCYNLDNTRLAIRILREFANQLESQIDAVNEANDIINEKK